MSLLLKHPDYKDFKNLSLKRIEEAKCLLDNKQFSGAYYLAGYSVEFALKACYCKTVPKKSFPPKRNIYDKLYKHDLNGLLDVSGIKHEFEKSLTENNDLNAKWEIIKDWNEESRYAIMIENDARPMIEAIIGVLQHFFCKFASIMV